MTIRKIFQRELNKKNMKHLTLVILFLCTTIFAQNKKPVWVEKRPINSAYYIGIGVAQKAGKNTQEYLQASKENALNDIAQQIVVNINATQLSQVTEKLGALQSDFQSHIQSSTKADLDNVESVDTYENENEYWTYVRLSIEEYKKLQAQKLKKATSLALDFFSKAKTDEKGNTIAEAVQLYVQALRAIEKHIGEPFEVEYNGTKIFLTNEIFSSLQSLLNKIEMKAKEGKLEGQVGKPMRKNPEVSVVVNDGNGKQTALPNFPVHFSFLRGGGDVLEHARTDKNGIVATSVTKITATDKLQIIKAEADLAGLLGKEKVSDVLNILLKSFTLPNARCVVNVTNLSVYFETEETIGGEKLRIPRIEPALKGTLSSQGFSFVDDVSKANVTISIKANGRAGGEYQGLYSTYVDVTISVLDLYSGEEIYKSSVNNVKGVSINYDKAGMKAYDEVAEKLKGEVIPAMLDKLRK